LSADNKTASTHVARKNFMQAFGLSLLLCCILITEAFGQDHELVQPRLLMKVAPQNFTQNELKISSEIFLGSAQNKVGVSH
jgi:hypothetical protein